MTQTHLFIAPHPDDQKLALEESTGRSDPNFSPLREGTAYLASPPHTDADLLDYCFRLNETLQPNTVRQYLYEIKILLNYLEAHGHAWEGLTDEMLRSYQQYRMNPQTDTSLGERTWRRAGAAIKGFIDFMCIRGRIEDNPIISINGATVLSPKGRRYPADIRAVPKERLDRFLRDGLGAAASYGVVTRLRNRMLAELMLKTGMRLGEASNLLTLELDTARTNDGIIQLEAVAKRQTMRHITVPAGMLSSLYAYIKIERACVVNSCQDRLRQRADLFEVKQIDGGMILGSVGDNKFRFRISKLPTALRRKAVRRIEERVEPLGLFLGARDGLPMGTAAWHKVFRRANSHLQQDDPTWFPIRSHDLRHTYASNALAQATALTARRQSDDSSLALQVASDPLGMVQRQLGHANPNTTAQYLRQPYTADSSLAKAIDSWISDDLDAEDHEGF